MLLNFLELIMSQVMSANETPNADMTNEIIATTLDTYLKSTVTDVIALQTPLGNRMLMSPHQQGQDGGHRFRIPLRTKKTDGLQAFGANTTITSVRKPVVESAWGTFKNALSYIRTGWVESRENSGTGKRVDIFAERLAATIQDGKEDFNTMMWGDGTGAGGKDFMGITGLIPADPRTGVIYGFDRALNFWWRPWYWDGVIFGPHPTDASAAAPVNVGAFGAITAPRGVASSFPIFKTGWNSTQQGENPADCFWISDQQTYEEYESKYPLYQHNVELAAGDDILKFGFGGAMFQNAPWLYDTTANGAPANELRLVNTKYLYMMKDTGAWFVWLPWREPYNQLDRVKYLAVRGNTACNNFRKQAVWQGITAWA